MTLRGQMLYPVPYQWRRVSTLLAVSVALFALGKAVDAPLGLAIGLVVVYPLALLPLGFYLREERRRLLALVGLGTPKRIVGT
jgi:hypothetical protein